MHSVFFRRLLIALIIAMLLASAFMVAGYVFLSRDTYTQIKLEEMLPKVEAIRQLFTEYRNGEMSDAAFGRMAKAMMNAASAMTVVFDSSGKAVFANSAISDLPTESASLAVQEQIASILAGNTVLQDDLKISGYGNVLVAGEPITDGDGGVIGGVLIIKSIQEIINATSKMNRSLFWIVLIVVPVMLLIITIRVRRITEPLHDMSEAAIRMSKGEFDIRANENELGEAGVLARALNNLCETLASTIYQLRIEKGQLDGILQSLTDGVAATDGLGTLTHYNTSLMHMFGAVNVEKREELIADEMVWKAFDEVFQSGEPQTVTYPTTNDRTLWISISPVKDEDGTRTGVVGLFKDMTDMERLEAMRREYVANVSHELRTPLTAVRGLLEPLADGMVKDEEDRQRYYKIMLHEVMRLSRLINDMLMLSRLQAGTEYVEYSRVNIIELVNDVAQGYSATTRQKGLELIVDAPEAPEALTDPDRIEQVLIILLDNASHYTPEGGSITIRVRTGQKLLVSVIDTGCGIPEADLPHIFERFYKVDKSRNEGGTGLGLSIAKYIMDKLEEDFTVDSTLGEGTCFTFTLKKYVSNAIELGPVSETRQKTPPNDAESAQSSANYNIVDAPYEVIEEPVKSNVKPAFKPQSDKKPEAGKRK